MEDFEERLQRLQETNRVERDALEEKATLMSARRTEEATAAAAEAGAAAAALAEMEVAKAAGVRSAQREALRAAEATASAAAAAAAADAAAAEISALKDCAAYLKERMNAIPNELRTAFEEELAEREGTVREKVRGEVRVLKGGPRGRHGVGGGIMRVLEGGIDVW